jgi:hypothetical protein
MSNKDRFPKNESKENNRVDDINLVSRLLEKMLEEQNKKVKEINVNMPLNNNSRFSQTIQPKSENKLNSVLKTMKNQVVNEDKNRLSAYSKIRSPTQKDLHITNTGNIPILMERESYIRDSRGSPNQSMKSENSKIVVDDAYRGSGSNQFNIADSKPYYQSVLIYNFRMINTEFRVLIRVLLSRGIKLIYLGALRTYYLTEMKDPCLTSKVQFKVKLSQHNLITTQI